jgi:hypothetical protein
MFHIIARDASETLDIMLLLSYYKVTVKKNTFKNLPGAILIGVYPCKSTETILQNDFRLAEMAFQMNYRQVLNICPVCKVKYPDEQTCGHLTFQGRIGG